MRINAVVNQALADPVVKAKLAELGGVPIPGTPEDFGRAVGSGTMCSTLTGFAFGACNLV